MRYIKTIPIVGILFVILFFSIGFSSDNLAFSATTHNVSLKSGSDERGCENSDSCLSQSRLSINAGDTVTWTNNAAEPHSIASGKDLTASDVGAVFDSGLLKPGASFSYTFHKAGTYNYFSMVAPWVQGTITVSGTSSGPGPVVDTPPTAAATTHKISIKSGSDERGCENSDSCLSQSRLSINAGDTVTWTNNAVNPHTITSGKDLSASDVGAVFDSDFMASGASFSYTFHKAGTYNYFSQISPWVQGTITVSGTSSGSGIVDTPRETSPGPEIKAIVADDPDSIGVGYSSGDTITVIFTQGTNQPFKGNNNILSKSDLDSFFSFSQNLGASYSGAWLKPKALVITIDDASGATPPEVGKLTVTVKDGANLKNRSGDSLVSSPSSPPLEGSFEGFEVKRELPAGGTLKAELPAGQTLEVKLPPAVSATVTAERTDKKTEIKDFDVIGDVVDIEASDNGCSETCEISFSFTQDDLDQKGIALEDVSIVHDMNENEVFEDGETIPTTVAQDGDSFIATGDASFTSRFAIGGVIRVVPLAVGAAETDEGGGCLIATATFGSELAPQVQMLREIRDNSVLTTQSGISFMTGFNQLYYSFSPTIADLERENPAFKEAVKLTITPLLTTLSILNYVDIDSEGEMLGYGIGIILMNIGMYFVAPAIVIIQFKKLRK